MEKAGRKENEIGGNTGFKALGWQLSMPNQVTRKLGSTSLPTQVYDLSMRSTINQLHDKNVIAEGSTEQCLPICGLTCITITWQLPRPTQVQNPWELRTGHLPFHQHPGGAAHIKGGEFLMARESKGYQHFAGYPGGALIKCKQATGA